jgi:hypothetical protein
MFEFLEQLASTWTVHRHIGARVPGKVKQSLLCRLRIIVGKVFFAAHLDVQLNVRCMALDQVTFPFKKMPAIGRQPGTLSCCIYCFV